MANESLLREIRLKVVTNGETDLKKAAQALGDINKNVKDLRGGFLTLRDVFLGTFAALRVRDLANVSDTMQQLQDRLKLVIQPGETARGVLGEIGVRADSTKQSVDELANSFSRIAVTAKGTGLTTRNLLDIVEELQNTFRISGATAEEAANATIQFSQALSIGVLRGQDFRSVASQNAVLAGILKEEFKGMRISLQEAADKGLLTTDRVLKALYKNMGDVKQQASGLSQTFGQTITLATNKFKLAILDLNNELDLSGKFAKAMDFALNHLKDIAAIVTSIAILALPLLITKIAELSAALTALVARNPILAALTAIAFVAYEVYTNFDLIDDKLKKLSASINEASAKFYEFAGNASTFIGDALTGEKSKNPFQDYIDGIRELAKEQRALAELPRPTDGLKEIQEFERNQPAALNYTGGTEKEKKIRDILAEINREYSEGIISAKTYFEKLDGYEVEKLNRAFRDGKIELDKYNDGLRKFEQRSIQREFNAGRITLAEFNKQMDESNLQKLNDEFAAGTITLQKYDEALNSIQGRFQGGSVIRAGTQGYLESIGTVASNVADAIKQTFTTLEDSFLEFIKTGQFNFEKFTQSILDDLTRIIIRAAIIRPLAQGILDFSLTPSATQSYQTQGSANQLGVAAANGAAFSGGFQAFANGGIVSSPTMFGYGTGRKGLMGEAGSEAILPLTRGSNGKLGVQASTNPVTINIINESGAEIVQETKTGANGEQQIEIMVKKIANKGFLDGSFDKSLRAGYGVTRRGS